MNIRFYKFDSDILLYKGKPCINFERLKLECDITEEEELGYYEVNIDNPLELELVSEGLIFKPCRIDWDEDYDTDEMIPMIEEWGSAGIYES